MKTKEKRMKNGLGWKRKSSGARYSRWETRLRRPDPEAYRIDIMPNGEYEITRIHLK